MYICIYIVRSIKSGRLRWSGHVARMERVGVVFKVLTSISKRHLGKFRSRWQNNIGIDLKKIGVNTRNWIDLPQDRGYWKGFVNVTLNLRVSQAMALDTLSLV